MLNHSPSLRHDFLLIRILLEHFNQIRAKLLAPLSGSTVTARLFIQNPKTGEIALCRLAVGSLPPGGSSSGTQNRWKSHVLPSGYEQPARRFLENFQKLRKTQTEQWKCMQFISNIIQFMLIN